jgi:hypothetical protein
LTTKEKVPKLKIVRGKDSRDNRGLMAELTTPIATPASKAAGKLAKSTPGKIMSITNKLRAVIKTVKRFRIIKFSSNFVLIIFYCVLMRISLKQL